MRTQPERRAGYTLVELLVVISIIAVIGGLGFLVGGVFLRTNNVSRAAIDIQNILFTAKQMALRDRIQTGIRLLPDDTGRITGLQYVQQPGDLTGGEVVVDPAAAPGSATNIVTFTNPEIVTGGLTAQASWPIQVGDYIQIQGREVKRIIAVASNGSAVQVATNYTGSRVQTTDYKVIRQPRPVAGEETVKLPVEVIIDMTPVATNANQGSRMVTSSGLVDLTPRVAGVPEYDLIFMPSGGLVGPNARGSKVLLWVRDTTLKDDDEQGMVTIFTRTGNIGVFPVDKTAGASPYGPAMTEIRAPGL